MKDAVKTVTVVRHIKTAPDSTGCGRVRARDSDIAAAGGLLHKDR